MVRREELLMSWTSWLVLGLGLLLFGPNLFRLAVGYRCPRCRAGRLQHYGTVYEFQLGALSHYICPRCNTGFAQRNGGPCKVINEARQTPGAMHSRPGESMSVP